MLIETTCAWWLGYGMSLFVLRVCACRTHWVGHRVVLDVVRETKIPPVLSNRAVNSYSIVFDLLE